MLGPREVADRDNFYMGMAMLYASKSKDPSTQCGAVIISAENKPLGWGYNGPPRLIDDNEMDWTREKKYPLIKHAEENAIIHSCGCFEGATLYVTGKPCPNCTLDMVAAEIPKVVYYPYISKNKSSMLNNNKLWEETLDIAKRGNLELVEFSGDLSWIDTRCNWMRDNNIL